MDVKTINMTNVTDEMLAEMFIDYINSMENEERHTKKACKEVENFDKYCEELFPNDIKQQTSIYDKMMDVAVEYEESGFIAGARWILNLIKEQEETKPTSI